MGRNEVVAEGMRWRGKLYYSQLVRYDLEMEGLRTAPLFLSIVWL